MNKPTFRKKIISQDGFIPTRKTRRKDVFRGPKRHKNGSIVQFTEMRKEELLPYEPFSKFNVPQNYYDDLATLKLVSSSYDAETEDLATVGLDTNWQFTLSRRILRRYGVMTIHTIGWLMIGGFFYNVRDPKPNEIPGFTFYSHDCSNDLVPVPCDVALCSGSSTNVIRSSNKVDMKLIQLAVMVMREMGIGYLVREDVIRLDDQMIVLDGTSTEGFHVVDDDPEIIPFKTIRTEGISDSFVVGLDETMSDKIFATPEDWCNYCMAVFYSVAGISGVPHYFGMFDSGGSGKSTLLGGLSSFAKTIATRSLQIENLTGRGFDRGMAVSQLEGKRIAIQDETTPIRADAMRMLNALSSGTTMEARYGGGLFNYVHLKLALWFAGNVEIKLPDIDAVNRRYVGIELKNELDHFDWLAPVDWDPEQRPLYEVAASPEAYARMFCKGLELWKERGGRFFAISRMTGEKEHDEQQVLDLLDGARHIIDGLQEISEAILAKPADAYAKGDAIEGVDMLGKSKSLHAAVRSAGFFEKQTTRKIDGKVAALKLLIVEDVQTMRRTHRLLQALDWLKSINVDADSNVLSASEWLQIADGRSRVSDFVKTETIGNAGDDKKSSDKRTYAVIQIPGIRKDVTTLVRSTWKEPPTSILHGFVRQVYFSKPFHSLGNNAVDTGLDWSLITDVEYGEKWAKALGLCRFIDVSTGRQTIGALNARDVYSSMTVVTDKFGAYL